MVEALTAILLLSPHIPLMFMGEEWGETRPFAFFTDFQGELADAVREGRRREFRHFAAFADAGARAPHPRPERLRRPSHASRDRLVRARDARRPGLARLTSPTLLDDPAARDRPAPRRRRPATAAGSLAADDGLVAVDWRLDGADLRLRANLTDTPRPAPAAAGRVIHGTRTDPLPPFAVLVALEERR